MNMKIPYGRQSISDQDIERVVQVLKADFLTQGPEIEAFEKAFAAYVGSTYAVAVSNGTAALHLCNLALGVKSGDRILTSPITFVASANGSLYCGAEVDFVDIDPVTYIMDLDALEAKIAGSPRGTYTGIVPVDFAGYPVDMERVRQIADANGLWVLEDACHAPGGAFIDAGQSSQRCGNGAFADLAIFSFHPVKHIAAGEGGMITTNDKSYFEVLKRLRTHGITKDENLLEENHGPWYYEMHDLGYNYRLTDMQAALASSQLERAQQGIERRRSIANRYDHELGAIEGLVIPEVDTSVAHAYHLYVIKVDDRKGLYLHLKENGIFAQVHYIPVHLQPHFKKMGWKKGDFPLSEAYYDRALSLPMFPSLLEEEQTFVIEKIREFLQA